jgi:hypothetical protein
VLIRVALAVSLSPTFAVLLSPTFANAGAQNAPVVRSAVLAQASPSPASSAPASPTASPSAGEEGSPTGIATGAGLVIAAILVGGLLLMRSRLLRR